MHYIIIAINTDTGEHHNFADIADSPMHACHKLAVRVYENSYGEFYLGDPDAVICAVDEGGVVYFPSRKRQAVHMTRLLDPSRVDQLDA